MSLQFNGTNGITYNDGTLQSTAYTGSGGGGDVVGATPSVDTAIGMVAPFAMDSVPIGWLHCDGSEVSRDTYSLLYAKVADLYGAGDGSTTFNLPNLQDEFIRGSSDTLPVGNKQDEEVGKHIHNIGGSAGQFPAAGGSGVQSVKGNTAAATYNAGNIGDGIGDETRPRNVAMLYCINATAEPSSGGGDAYTKEESDAIDNAQDVKIVINNDDIARQQIEITNNTAEIGKNTSSINTNIINIAQNSEDIAELQDSSVWTEVDGVAVYDGDIEVNGVTVGKGNSSGTGNTAVGVNALQKETTGNYNTAVGSQSLQNSKTGGANTAVGHSSLAGIISGDKNSAIGKSAGNTLTTGINNIILGWNAQPSAPNVSNEVTIGNADTATIRMGNGDILYPSSGDGGGIPEAPVDGKQYGRQDAEWTEVVGGGGGSTDGYTKAEINAQQSAQDVKINKNYDDILYLETKADTNLAYIADNVEAIAKNTADIAALPPYVDAYSKTATDTLLDAKANKEDTYTKAETDAEIAAAGGGGGTDDTYTKVESDAINDAQDVSISANTAAIEINTTDISTKIDEAPIDGKEYTRKDAGWTERTSDGVWTEVDGDAVFDGTIDVQSVESYNDITIGPYEYNAAYGMKVGHGSGGFIDYLGRPVPISSNVAIGYETLIGGNAATVNSGQNIVAVGNGALKANLGGNNNTAVGHTALKANTNGVDNTAVGVTASLGNITGRNNSSFGKSALLDNQEGDSNTAIGHESLYQNLGDKNTALGARAGLFLVSGSNNILLGYEARASSNTVSNEITLGNADVTTVRMGNGDIIYPLSGGGSGSDSIWTEVDGVATYDGDVDISNGLTVNGQAFNIADLPSLPDAVLATDEVRVQRDGVDYKTTIDKL